MSQFRIYNRTLCPELWDEYSHLDPRSRVNLLRMAYDFYEHTNFKAPIIDIYLMGSIANYNWSPQSDVDVHIIVDFNQLQIPLDTAEEAMKSESALWNDQHNVIIKGHKAEMNIQNSNEVKPHVTGIYSLVKDQWIRNPVVKNDIQVDKVSIQSKYSGLKTYIDTSINSGNREEMKKAKKYIDAFRQYGLDTVGELSIENIIFKILRSRGLIKRLKDSIVAIYDKEMTVAEVGKKNRTGDCDYIGGILSGEVRGEPVKKGTVLKRVHGDFKGLFSGQNSTNWRYERDKNLVWWNLKPEQESVDEVNEWLEMRGIINPRHKAMYNFDESAVSEMTQKDQDIKDKQVTSRFPHINDGNLIVTVQKDASLPEANFVQIDDVSKGDNHFSSNPEDMIKYGYKLPTSAEFLTLPAGRYKLSKAVKVLKRLFEGKVTHRDINARYPRIPGAIYKGDVDLTKMNLSNLMSMKKKAARFWDYARKHNDEVKCKTALEDFKMYDDEIKRRLKYINKPINEEKVTYKDINPNNTSSYVGNDINMMTLDDLKSKKSDAASKWEIARRHNDEAGELKAFNDTKLYDDEIKRRLAYINKPIREDHKAGSVDLKNNYISSKDIDEAQNLCNKQFFHIVELIKLFLKTTFIGDKETSEQISNTIDSGSGGIRMAIESIGNKFLNAYPDKRNELKEAVENIMGHVTHLDNQIKTICDSLNTHGNFINASRETEHLNEIIALTKRSIENIFKLFRGEPLTEISLPEKPEDPFDALVDVFKNLFGYKEEPVGESPPHASNNLIEAKRECRNGVDHLINITKTILELNINNKVGREKEFDAALTKVSISLMELVALWAKKFLDENPERERSLIIMAKEIANHLFQIKGQLDVVKRTIKSEDYPGKSTILSKQITHLNEILQETHKSITKVFEIGEGKPLMESTQVKEGFGLGHNPEKDPLHIPGERWRIKFGGRKTPKMPAEEDIKKKDNPKEEDKIDEFWWMTPELKFEKVPFMGHMAWARRYQQEQSIKLEPNEKVYLMMYRLKFIRVSKINNKHDNTSTLIYNYDKIKPLSPKQIQALKDWALDNRCDFIKDETLGRTENLLESLTGKTLEVWKSENQEN